MNRVVVIGSSGSGKTTVAKEIANRLDSPFLELDAIAHREGWDATPVEVFQNEVEDLGAHGSWAR